MVSATNLSIALGVGWAFGAAVFGVYSFFALIALLATNLLTAALAEPAAAISANLTVSERQAYFAALAASFVVGTVVALVPLHYFLIFLQQVFLQSVTINSILVTAFVMTLLCAGVLRTFLQAFAPGTVILGSDLLRSSLAIIALAMVVIAPRYGIDANPYVSVIALQMAAVVVYLMCCAVYAAAKHFVVRPDFHHFRTHWPKSRLTTAITGVRIFQVNAPILWAQYLLGEEIFGLIRTYQTIANFVALPLNALSLNNVSRSAVAFASGGIGSLIRHVTGFLTKLTLATVAGSGAVLLVLFLLPSDLRPDARGFLYITLFLICAVLVAINASLAAYFHARGRLLPLFLRSAVGAVIAIVGAPLLLDSMGGIGAPASLLAVSLFVSIATTVFIYRDSRSLSPDVLGESDHDGPYDD